MDQHTDDETLIEHFEKCVPGGKEALDKARHELEEHAETKGLKPRRRRRKET